ncbi:MerR family DNA-binding transcriptional regulator [Wukongibacter baidiensis]|uniref:MerR family DNA-binding transcriptional regulator n=1 Tax=Wukongibacter baidiensis TaxID=1723361 RepID=UPI003D7F2ACF
MKEFYFKTGDLAKLFNISSDTVRYYSKLGFIKPSIEENGYRYFSLQDLMILGNVVWSRELDIPIERIKEWLGIEIIDQFVEFNNNYLEILEKKAELINKQIEYLKAFNKKAEVFKESVDKIELTFDDYIYVHDKLSISSKDLIEELKKNWQILLGNTDTFWLRTGKVLLSRSKEDFYNDSVNNNMSICNIVPSRCGNAKILKFGKALRYRFIGDENELIMAYRMLKEYMIANNYKIRDRIYEVEHLIYYGDGSLRLSVEIYLPIA